jgi:16S rRNA (adenine1518-N6/adenine1519-N6)-dimethyltransferase
MSRDLQKGQHFMVDEELISRVVEEAELSSFDSVLEVGVGDGALTKQLLKSDFKELTCIEIDPSLPNPCDGAKIDSSVIKKTNFITGNALELIPSMNFTTVVSNIPYHISEPLFKEFLFKLPEKIIVVVGNSFSKLLLGNSILGIIFRLYYDVVVVEEISPSAFDPRPRTKSSLVKLIKRNGDAPLEKPALVLSKFFRYPRSKVKNFLKASTDGLLTKRFVDNSLSAWISSSTISERDFLEQLLDKQLSAISTEEFLIMKDFIYFNLFGIE